MGLDIVELIMRVEEEFEITIEDEEASLCSTVGQIHRLILMKRNSEPLAGCPSSALFYQVRRDLVAFTDLTRREIRPNTALDQIVPLSQRHAYWHHLQTQNGVILPDLVPPNWLLSTQGWAFFVSWIAAIFAFVSGNAVVGSALLLSGIPALWLFTFLFRPWTRHFPTSCRTTGDITRFLLISQTLKAPGSASTIQSEATWQKLRSVVADELGVPLEIVTPKADLIRDLGAD